MITTNAFLKVQIPLGKLTVQILVLKKILISSCLILSYLAFTIVLFLINNSTMSEVTFILIVDIYVKR